MDDKSLYENVEVRVEDADAVLKELKPPNGIKMLTIWGYSSQLPNMDVGVLPASTFGRDSSERLQKMPTSSTVLTATIS